jgi:hypothetical protein
MCETIESKDRMKHDDICDGLLASDFLYGVSSTVDLNAFLKLLLAMGD